MCTNIGLLHIESSAAKVYYQVLALMIKLRLGFTTTNMCLVFYTQRYKTAKWFDFRSLLWCLSQTMNYILY